MNKVSVFLDTDIGDDIDDTWALAFLLNCPEIKLEYALTCNSPAPYRAKLIAKILQWAGDTTTPIGFGIPTAPKNIPMGFRKSQAAWIEDFELKKVQNPIFENGVEEFVKKIDRHKRKCWLEMEMFGRTVTMQVGLEVVSKS